MGASFIFSEDYMDRETILKLVGELYINNYILTQKNEELNAEIIKLKNIIEQLNGQDRT